MNTRLQAHGRFKSTPQGGACRISTLLLFTFTFFAIMLSPGYSLKSTDTCIAVLFCGEFNSCLNDMEQGIRQAAGRHGIKVAIIEMEGCGESEMERALRLIAEKRIQALLIVPEGQEHAQKYCMPLILEANRRRIPVAFLHGMLDDDLLRAYGAKIETVVSGDGRKGGRLAAEYIARQAGGKGGVLMLEGSRNGRPERERAEGFRQALARYPGMKLITAPPSRWSRSGAYRATGKVLANRGDIQAVFALSDSMALGASDAIRLSKLRRPLLVGCDGTEEGIRAIYDGRIDATVDLAPYTAGKTAVESLLKVIDGEKVPPVIMVRTELLSRQNIELPFGDVRLNYHFRSAL